MALIGATVMKDTLLSTYEDGSAMRTAIAEGFHLLGRVVGTAPPLPSGEPVYLVVYEDGEEAFLSEFEVRLWTATFIPGMSRAGFTTAYPPVSTSTWNSVMSHMPAGVTTTTSFHNECQMQPQFSSIEMTPRWRAPRSISQGRMPPRQWSGQHTYTQAQTSMIGCLARGLIIVLFALLVVLSINNAIDLLGQGAGFEDLASWTRSKGVEDVAVWTDAAVVGTQKAMARAGGIVLGLLFGV